MMHVDRRIARSRRGFPARSCGRGRRYWRGSRTAAASTRRASASTSSQRALDRALHALFARGQVEGRAIGQHQPAAFDRHAFGHDQDQLVALDRGDHRQADAGIAAGRLDDRAAGLELAVALGRLDHRQRDAVLDRPAGVGPLGLDPDFGVREQPAATRMCGVLPIVSRMVLAFMTWPPLLAVEFGDFGRVEGLGKPRVRGRDRVHRSVIDDRADAAEHDRADRAEQRRDAARSRPRRARSRPRSSAATPRRRGRASSSGVWSWISDWRT